MSSGTQACEIVLPGYVLADRIGSGGYAEVWRAEAPGGIQKAVKIVYGYYDDEFASQELKALERIKGVRHPFLLSLERFEIISGRLAILTELADMSLDQRLRECRAEGLNGIPRDELLRYMADAAEALDFLSQKHNLLHLDIKPENLLVLGDHIKVADFGLVKELASRTQNSLVSGMTPTYASPEMFDDEPSQHSDQYSLAIVYQEMLVGTLPFPGRTAAQLAKQHTQAEPQLLSLPATDRPAIARALAKNPLERYPSCKAFVDALLHRAESIPDAPPAKAPQPKPVAPQPSVPSPDDTLPSSPRTTMRRGVEPPIESRDVTRTQPVKRAELVAAAPAVEEAKAPEPIVPEETIDVAVPETNGLLSREQPTLYIAIGGVGIQTLCRLRTLSAANRENETENSAKESVAFDTDRDELREACSSRLKSPLVSDDTLHLPLRLPKSYDDSREILGWVSRRWLYNIPRSLETRGYRPLGRVALIDHAKRVLALLDQKLERLATAAGTADSSGAVRDTTIRVVILSGMGGGTGAGMTIDVANAVRSLAEKRGLAVEVQGFLICTCFGSANASPLVAANTYSLLTELNHVAELGNVGVGDQAGGNPFVSTRLPFDSVYCVPLRARTSESQAGDALDAVARYLALEESPEVRTVMRSCRATQTRKEQSRTRPLVFRKLGFASIVDRKRELLSDLASDLAGAVKRQWLSEDRSADWPRLIHEEQQAASAPKLQKPADEDPNAPLVVAPVNDATPLALRARFKDYLASQFASDVLSQIQRQLEARDDRGRPLLVPREAKQIADEARKFVSALATRGASESGIGDKFSDSPTLAGLIHEASQRALQCAVEKFDPRQPDRFLPPDAIDEMLHAACLTLLDERQTEPVFGEAIAALMQLDEALKRTVELASTPLLQCGCDRRTLIVVPPDQANTAATEKVRAERPLAAIATAQVDDIVVITEDAGVSPRTFALGLERVFPGITEAARRLLTRTDVEWKNVV